MKTLVAVLTLVSLASAGPITRFDPDNDVLLRLFTRSNPEEPQLLALGNYSSILLSNFNLQKKLKIFSHGWTNTWQETNLVKAWLDYEDVNVILVDWTIATNTTDEALLVSRVPLVGQYVARFIDWISTYGIRHDETHVVGMSIGSHVAGHIGRFCQSGKIEYITGCDPPRAFWQDIGGNINVNDGTYVEIIHTSILVHTFEQPIGTADFYPNGGLTMPGCDGNHLCDHTRSVRYLIESVGNKNFAAMKCNNYEEVESNSCADIGRSYMGGTEGNKNITGVYYLTTNADSPFAQGDIIMSNKIHNF